MRIAITGGRGFIGRATTAWAVKAGHEVIPFDRTDGNDILGQLGALEGAEHVIHLAGVLGTHELFDTPRRAVEVNVMGTLRILEWCRTHKAGYTGITMPDSGWANVYTATKHCARDFAEAYRRHQDVSVSNVCAFNAYGPGQAFGPGHPRKIIPTFVIQALRGESIEIWGDGEQTVDLVHTDDVGRMLADAVRFGEGQTFDAGTGVAFTVNEIADRVRKMAGSSAPHTHRPMRRGEDRRTRIVAQGRGWDLLGWKPEHDDSKLIQCIDWYREALLKVSRGETH